MKIIIQALSYILIAFVIGRILGNGGKPEKAEKGHVKIRKSVGIIGGIGFAFCLTLAIITTYAGVSRWVPVLFFVFALLSAILIIAFLNCRISYDEEGFVTKNFFGIKRKYTYSQVTSIRETPQQKYIDVGKRSVELDIICVGTDEFIAVVEQKYSLLHGGQSIPQREKAKYDLFDGNVVNAEQKLGMYICIGIMLIVAVVAAVVYTFFSPKTADNTIKHTVCFISCDVREDEVVLTSVDGQIYAIRFIDEQFDAQKFAALCDGKTLVTTYSIEITPDDREDYYAIKAIEHNGTYLLTFEETNRFHTQEYWPLIAFAAGLCLLWLAYIAGAVKVGRNPQRYSKRVRKFFFNDGEINKNAVI